MDRYEIRATLLENAKKLQALFEKSMKSIDPLSFEITDYSEQITNIYKTVLKDMQAEYEERALEKLAKQKEEEACTELT